MADTEGGMDFASLLRDFGNRAAAHIDDLRNRNSYLTDQVAKVKDARAQHDALQREHNQLLTRLKLAQDASKNLKKENTTHSATLRRLENETSSALKKADSASRELAATKNSLSKSEQTNKELHSLTSTLEHTIGAEDKAMAQLLSDKTSKALRCKSLSEENGALKAHLRQLTEGLEVAVAEKEKLSQSCATQQATIKKQIAEMSKRNFRSDGFPTKDVMFQELYKTIQCLQDHKYAAAGELRQTRDQHDLIRTELRTLEIECEDLRDHREILAHQLEGHKKMLSELEIKFADPIERLQRVEGQVRDGELERRTLGNAAREISNVRVAAAMLSHFERNPQQDFETNSVTFGIGQAPDHGTSLHQLWANLDSPEHVKPWRSRAGLEIAPYGRCLTRIDLSELPPEVVAENIGYHDISRECGPNATDQQVIAISPADAEPRRHPCKPHADILGDRGLSTVASTETPEPGFVPDNNLNSPFVMPTPESPRRSASSISIVVPTGCRKRLQSRSPERDRGHEALCRTSRRH